MATAKTWYESQLTPPRNKDSDSSDSEHKNVKEKPGQVADILQKCRKGRIQYDTGWDTQPFSILRLISDVQAESHNYVQRNLERAALIVEQSTLNNERIERKRLSNASSSSQKSRNIPADMTINSFYTAENTLSSPQNYSASKTSFRHSAPALDYSAGDSSKHESRSIHGFRVLDEEEYSEDYQADDLALNTRSPIYARFEKLNAEYEQGRIASWLAKCREKTAKVEEEDRKREAAQKEAALRQKLENEQRKAAAALERKKKALALETLIAEQRRRISIQSEMQERETNRAREQEEKDRLKQLEDEKRKAEEEMARLVAQENAEKKAEELRLRQEEQQLAAAAAQQQKQVDSSQIPTAITEVTPSAHTQEISGPSIPPTRSRVPPEFEGMVSGDDLTNYLRSQESLEELKRKIDHISISSAKTKSFYSAALKVISTPLNAVSTLSPNHLQEKLNHFINLLDRKHVLVGEMTKPFISSSEVNGEFFVQNLFAYRFVKKAEAEVTKGDRSIALAPLATIGAHVARRFPDWRMTCRAYFYKMCPFLVPFSYPRNNMTIEEYANSIGQNISGSESVVLQVLLERMAGYTTLYALMVVEFDRLGGDTSSDQFFTYSELWRILVGTLKIEPQRDVTATIIHAILQTVGDKLATSYRIQFRKYLQILLNIYLSKISEKGKGAPLARLELFLESKAQTWFRLK